MTRDSPVFVRNLLNVFFAENLFKPLAFCFAANNLIDSFKAALHDFVSSVAFYEIDEVRAFLVNLTHAFGAVVQFTNVT